MTDKKVKNYNTEVASLEDSARAEIVFLEDRNQPMINNKMKNINLEDIEMPRVKLVQHMSDEVSSQTELVKNISPGDIINSITKEKLEKDFIPVFMFKEYVKFNPRNKTSPDYDPSYMPGALIWRTTNPLDPRVEQTKFGPNGDKPSAFASISFLCMFDKSIMPLILSFNKSSYKEGKKLLTMALFLGNNMWDNKYTISAVLEKNDLGSFYKLKATISGNKVNDNERKTCLNINNDFSGKIHELFVDEISSIE